MIGKKINQLATELAPVSTDLTIIGDPISGVSKKITLAQLGAIFSGAVSFYTNLAGFPAVGDINVIYCAKDTQKLYLWSGSAYVEVFPSQALLDTYQLRSEKGNANGYASLDSQGKVPISQLPSSIMEYKGTWNASTNTPTLANGTGDTGDVYICNVAGTVNFGAGNITFAVGDYVIYSGTIWQRSSGAVGTVTSVAASITGNSVTISGSPVTTSGTLAFAFAGTGAQYIKGDGTLATFPNTIDQAKNLITEVYNSTGATLTKGTVVYINGGQGNLPTVTKALATGDSTSAQTYGIVQADITNNNNGFVVVAGRLADIDTSAFSVGTQLYLSSTTAGAYTSTKQYAPAHLVYVGIIVRSHPTQGIIEVKIQNGYELDELHDVAAQTPTNNDGLFWEASTSLWKNKSIATILGYTPQAQLNGTGFVKASGTTITYDNSTYLTTSAAATTYLPLVLSSTTNFVDINGQQFSIYGSAGGYTSGRIIVDPVFSAIGYQNAGVFDGLKILTNGNAEFSNSGVTRFFNQVRFDSTLTNGTYTYTLPGATGTIALVGGAGVGTVTSVSALTIGTSGTDISSTVANSTTTPVITLNVPTASATNRGALSSTDWTTFNNKQNALTNPVTGTGTTNYLPKFTGTSTIGNSAIVDNSGNIGIGIASPRNIANYTFTAINGTTGAYLDLYTNGTIAGSIGSESSSFVITSQNSNGISFLTPLNSYSTKMFLNNSGNLGLGVTPSAWGDLYGSAIQVRGGSILGFSTSVFDISQNAYADNSTYRYVVNGAASQYRQESGSHKWYNVGSGTAGNAISFTQAMTLNASGNLGIGTSDLTALSGTRGLVINGGTIADVQLKLQNNNTGSASGDGILLSLASDNTGYLWNYENQALIFGTNNTERMRITSAGELCVGRTSAYGAGFLVNVQGNIYASSAIVAGSSVTAGGILLNGSTTITSPIDTGSTKAYFDASSINGAALTLRSDSVGRTIRLISDGSGTTTAAIDCNSTGLGIGTNTNHPILFTPNATERMRITSGGLVGIGTSSPATTLDVRGSTSSTIRVGSSTHGGSGDEFANLEFFWGDPDYAEVKAKIYTKNTGNVGPGGGGAADLIFATRPAFGSLAERLKITSDGFLKLREATSSTTAVHILQADTTSDAVTQVRNFNTSTTSDGLLAVVAERNTTNNTFYALGYYNTGAGAWKFRVADSGNVTNTNNSYGGISDITLKENISDTTSKLADLLKVKVRNYNLIGDDKKQIGVIAQELETIFPSMIDTDKETGLKSVKYSVFVPMLIKAIQELNDKIK